MRPAAAAHPTRTLFVRGLAPSTTEEDLRKFLEVHGEVRKVVTTFIPTKGFSFVTFYDIRHAEAALSRNGHELNGKKVEIAFSVPKDKDEERPDADTLFVIKKSDPSPIDSAELARLFSQWGEIKRIGDNVRSNVQKFVQYYDTRAIARALKEGSGIAFEGGTLDVEEAKSNFSGKPPRERTRAAEPRVGGGSDASRRRSRSRSRSNSRERRRRRRDSRSRSKSPSSRKRRSRSRSEERARHSSSHPPPVQVPPNLYTPMQPAYMGYQPPPPQPPQADASQLLGLVQNNPQLLSMLLLQLQQQQQQQQMPLLPVQQQLPPQLAPQLSGQPRYYSPPQTHPSSSGSGYYSNPPPASSSSSSSGRSNAPPPSSSNASQLASLAASLERLKSVRK